MTVRLSPLNDTMFSHFDPSVLKYVLLHLQGFSIHLSYLQPIYNPSAGDDGSESAKEITALSQHEWHLSLRKLI